MRRRTAAPSTCLAAILLALSGHAPASLAAREVERPPFGLTLRTVVAWEQWSIDQNVRVHRPGLAGYDDARVLERIHSPFAADLEPELTLRIRRAFLRAGVLRRSDASARGDVRFLRQRYDLGSAWTWSGRMSRELSLFIGYRAIDVEVPEVPTSGLHSHSTGTPVFGGSLALGVDRSPVMLRACLVAPPTVVLLFSSDPLYESARFGEGSVEANLRLTPLRSRLSMGYRIWGFGAPYKPYPLTLSLNDKALRARSYWAAGPFAALELAR
jgi:hypothetical protein